MAQDRWFLKSHDVGTHYEQHCIYQKADPNPAIDGAYHVAQVKHMDDALLIVAAPDLRAVLTDVVEMTKWLIRNAPDNYWIDWLHTIEMNKRIEMADAILARVKGNE